WMPKQDIYLEDIISNEAHPHVTKACTHCPDIEKGEALYRCSDCFEMEPVCQLCCVHEHSQLPLHGVEFWNGAFFERVSLRSLGLRVQLGHGGNSPCPMRNETPDRFTVIHSNGIHIVSVDFCKCHEGSTSGEEYRQLLRNEWVPSTHLEPQTAATFR
ncbi:hypothetical protein C8J56DRAFT_765507, partial [Mycena floridula]